MIFRPSDRPCSFLPKARGAWLPIEHTDGVPDAVLAVGRRGVEVRTESATRPRQPLSVRVGNLQLASSDARVHEVARDVWVAGVPHPVRVLQSGDSFGFVIGVGGRVVRVAGRLSAFATLRLEQLPT